MEISSVGGVELSLDQSDDDVLHTGASKIIGVFVFIFPVVCYLRISHFAPFCFSFLDHTTCHSLAWLFCTGNKHVEHIFDMICLGQNRAFLHRRLRFSGYCVPANAPFLYIAKGVKALCGNAYPT